MASGVLFHNDSRHHVRRRVDLGAAATTYTVIIYLKQKFIDTSYDLD